MTEGELESRFQKLLDRTPTDHEKILLLQLQKRLGISDDDSLWLILVALSHYEHLYRQIPEAIQTAGSFAVERAKTRFELETEAERKRIQGALTEAVLETVEVTVNNRWKAQRRWASAMNGLVSLFLLLFVAVATYHWGYDKGEISSSAAQLWALSDEGQYAYRLEMHGILNMLRQCQASGSELRITRERKIICITQTGVSVLGPVPDSVLMPS